jgi:hypothetical protein
LIGDYFKKVGFGGHGGILFIPPGGYLQGGFIYLAIEN